MLGNDEDYFNIQPDYFNDLNENNAIDKLLILTNFFNETSEQLIFENNQNNSKIIDFISANFDKIDKEKLAQFDISILELIIRNEKNYVERRGFVVKVYFESL